MLGLSCPMNMPQFLDVSFPSAVHCVGNVCCLYLIPAPYHRPVAVANLAMRIKARRASYSKRAAIASATCLKNVTTPETVASGFSFSHASFTMLLSGDCFAS